MTEEGTGSGRPSLADQRGVETVYQPAEDSDLLARTAVERIAPGDRALDVGTGSGYVAATLAEAGADAVGVDLSPLACREAADNGVPVVRGDLVVPFQDGAFDLVAFNPPYLPTPEDGPWDDWMEVALSGGEDGREVIEPFLDSVGRVLAPDGAVYLLVSSLTGVEEVVQLAADEGLSAVALQDESFPFETLTVLKLTR